MGFGRPVTPGHCPDPFSMSTGKVSENGIPSPKTIEDTGDHSTTTVIGDPTERLFNRFSNLYKGLPSYTTYRVYPGALPPTWRLPGNTIPSSFPGASTRPICINSDKSNKGIHIKI